jgi:hypothetical protein
MIERRIDRPRIDRPRIGGQAARKIKLIYRVAANVADDMVQRSRTGRAVLAGTRAIARSFGRVLYQLWLEVTGFTFLAIAGIGALAGMREYGKYQSGHAAGPGRLVLAVCFTISFIWFGLSSFWRVKKRAKGLGATGCELRAKPETAETPRTAEKFIR